jgi:hypothetical protein
MIVSYIRIGKTIFAANNEEKLHLDINVQTNSNPIKTITT